MRRRRIPGIDLLKRRLARLSDDLSLPWGTYRCMEWPNIKRGRYGSISVSGKSTRTHRLAYEIAIGPIPDGLWVLHKCDNPSCFRPVHLFLGTARDNTLDCVQKGRKNAPFGERHSKAKLTDEDARLIRTLYAKGLPERMLAESCGVTRQCVREVVTGRSWKHIPNHFSSAADMGAAR